MINIIYNDIHIEVPSGLTVKDFIESQGVVAGGTGVAVNNVFIRQSNWDKYLLREGDNVVVIRASFGG